MSDPSPHLEVRRFGSTDAIRLGVLIWPCYDEVFGDFDDFRTWNDDLFRRHATRSGYRLVVATDGSAVAADGSDLSPASAGATSVSGASTGPILSAMRCPAA